MNTLNVLILSLILFVYPCLSVIYHLNETEYARMPAVFELDEYEECLAQQGGQYCQLQLQLFDDGDNPLMDMIREYSECTIKHYNHSLIERGVCVRRTCAKFLDGNLKTEEGLKQSLAACLNESIWRDYQLQANVSKVYYCDKHGEYMDINALDWAVLAVLILIVIVNVAGSCYDYVISHYNDGSIIGNKYILSFSLSRNFEWLTSYKPENPRLKDLQFLHCIRALICFLIALPHAMQIITAYTRNTHDFEKTFDDMFFQLVSNGMMIVQIFLFISGFLLAYNFQIYSRRVSVSWTHFPKVLLLRWFRLSPALAVLLAFNATWLRHLGSGPLWNLEVTTTVVADCRSYWWYHLLYVNNYVTDDKYCAIPTWYIAADSQVYIVGLLVCVATARRGRYLALAAVLLVGTAVPALQVWWQDLDGVVILSPEFFRTLYDRTLRYSHMAGHTNLQAFVVGMMVAHLIYDWQERGVDLSKNKHYSWVFWLTPLAVALCFSSGSIFYVDGERAPAFLRALYAAAHRLVLALVVTPFAIGMVLKAPSYFRTITLWRLWVVPSRLTYSVYLLHINLVHILMGFSQGLQTVAFYHVCIAHLGIVFLTYMLAVPFFLMVEAPFNKLIKVLLEPHIPSDLHSRKTQIPGKV